MRLNEVSWVTEHLRDLEADFRVFYRIDDIHDMPSAQFFSLAHRVAAYDGVVTARAVAEQEKAEKGAAGGRAPVVPGTHFKQETLDAGTVVRSESTQRSYIHDVLAKVGT